jgi:hypothetical protein
VVPARADPGLADKSPPPVSDCDHAERSPDSKPSAKIRSGSKRWPETPCVKQAGLCYFSLT